MNNLEMIDNLPSRAALSTTDTMIRLAHVFLRFAQRDGDQSSENLSVHIGELRECLSKLMDIESKHDENVEKMGSVGSYQMALVGNAMNALNQIVVSLQFFDRISQRMDHSLKCLQVLESTDLTSPLDGEFDVSAIHNILTMEDERDVFFQVMEGVSVGDAIDKAFTDIEKQADNDDSIELF